MNTFYNNVNNIIIKYHHDLNGLPKSNLITYILKDGHYYGFYTTENMDMVDDNSYLFTGDSIEIPIDVSKLLLCPNINPKRKITNYSVANNGSRLYVKTYFKTSENKFKVNCLYHSDKTPSMHVEVEKGIFHCFTCNASGTILKLANKIRASECRQTEHISTFGVK